MTGKAGIVHLHMGDGPRGLGPVRDAIDGSELPAGVFNPTHVNRRKALFDEAMALTERGCTIDITAFPVEEGEDAWPASDALVRYLDAGLRPIALRSAPTVAAACRCSTPRDESPRWTWVSRPR